MSLQIVQKSSQWPALIAVTYLWLKWTWELWRQRRFVFVYVWY